MPATELNIEPRKPADRTPVTSATSTAAGMGASVLYTKASDTYALNQRTTTTKEDRSRRKERIHIWIWPSRQVAAHAPIRAPRAVCLSAAAATRAPHRHPRLSRVHARVLDARRAVLRPAAPATQAAHAPKESNVGVTARQHSDRRRREVRICGGMLQMKSINAYTLRQCPAPAALCSPLDAWALAADE